MVRLDEDALICDLAETYHIYNYRELPPLQVAIFACGLNDESRIKMKMLARRVPTDRLILAAIADHLAFIAWSKTKDAKDNINRPKRLVPVLLGESINDDNDVQAFDTVEDFREAWTRIVETE